MRPDPDHDAIGAPWITRCQVGLGVLVVLAAALWVLQMVFWDPSVPFLTRADDPTWITSYRPIHTDGIRVDQDAVPAMTFVRSFSLDAPPASARLAVRAVGAIAIQLNGSSVWRRPQAGGETEVDESWKDWTVLDVGERLASGSNELRARVANPRGPALLQLRIESEAGAELVATDATWRALDGTGRRLDTMRASDTRPDPQSFSMPATGTVLVRLAAPLALLFALGAALERLLATRLRGSERVPELVLGAATLFWLAVYSFKSTSLPVLMGFDIVGHLAYVDFLLERGALPFATDGWSMYHPPLGHALVAGLVALFDVARESQAGRVLYRLPAFAAGLAGVWAVAFAARRLFPDAPLHRGLAVAFAALLPMNLYMSAYVSNEPVHSALVTAALTLACASLVGGPARWQSLAAIAATLGLAISTKFTALLAVPLVAFFQASKAATVDRVRTGPALAQGAAVLAGALAIGGWFYLRNWQRFGRPLVGNWDLPGNLVWWEQPGFHTLDYYTSFGQSLTHPFFSGYASFWDGVYSTFWGDGLAAGMVRLATRHEAWSYEFMTAVYWLAFPATLLLGVGFVRGARRAVADPRLGWRHAATLLLAHLSLAAFSLFAITFQLPYYAQAKAFYVLSALLPLAFVGALGLAWPLERIPDRLWPLRTVYAGWLGMLGGSIALAFLA